MPPKLWGRRSPVLCSGSCREIGSPLDEDPEKVAYSGAGVCWTRGSD